MLVTRINIYKMHLEEKDLANEIDTKYWDIWNLIDTHFDEE